MVSSILRAPEVASSQNNKAATINAAIARLEQATQNTLVNTAMSSETPTANTWTLTEAEFLSYFRFVASGGGAAMTLETQGSNTELVATDRFFCVENADTTYNLTVKSDAAGDTVVLAPGDIVLVHQIGDDITTVGAPAVTPVIPYDVSMYFSGTPTASQILAEVEFARTCTIPDDFAGSQAYIGTNPTDATWVMDIQKNGSSVGSLSITTAGAITFATTGTTVAMTPGDRLSFVAPGTVDSTAATFAVTIASTID